MYAFLFAGVLVIMQAQREFVNKATIVPCVDKLCRSKAIKEDFTESTIGELRNARYDHLVLFVYAHNEFPRQPPLLKMNAFKRADK